MPFARRPTWIEYKGCIDSFDADISPSRFSWFPFESYIHPGIYKDKAKLQTKAIQIKAQMIEERKQDGERERGRGGASKW